MIPIKILCECGQKYAFDAEPIGGRISQAVQCPVCGIDGTTATNQLIAQHLAVNVTPASGLRIGGQQPPATVPLPPQNFTSARDRNFGGVKVRNKRLNLALGGAGVAILVLAGAVMFSLSANRKPEPAALFAGSTDGLPNTLAELDAWYVEPPAGQNAAAFYSRGLDALQIGKAASSNLPLLGKGQLPPLGSPMPTSLKSTLATFVKSNRDALRFFAEGTKYDRCRYPVDLTLGYDALFPHVPKLKNAALLVELSAISHAEANQAEEAANDVLIGLGLAHSLADEPALLSQLIRATSISAAVAALEQTVNRTTLPAGTASELSKVFRKMEDYDARGEGFGRALAAERAISLTMLATPQKLLPAVSAPGLNIPADQRDQTMARLQKGDPLKEELEFLATSFRQLLAARKETFPDRLKTDDRIRQRVTEAASKKLVIIEVLVAGLAGRTAIEAESLARLRLGWTAVALEQFRAAHGRQYPATLSELTPEFLSATPADPFDGQPLRYRKKAGGYALYSIGPDLKDDSGERKQGKDGDIVFAVITPARADR